MASKKCYLNNKVGICRSHCVLVTKKLVQVAPSLLIVTHLPLNMHLFINYSIYGWFFLSGITWWHTDAWKDEQRRGSPVFRTAPFCTRGNASFQRTSQRPADMFCGKHGSNTATPTTREKIYTSLAAKLILTFRHISSGVAIVNQLKVIHTFGLARLWRRVPFLTQGLGRAQEL